MCAGTGGRLSDIIAKQSDLDNSFYYDELSIKNLLVIGSWISKNRASTYIDYIGCHRPCIRVPSTKFMPIKEFLKMEGTIRFIKHFDRTCDQKFKGMLVETTLAGDPCLSQHIISEYLQAHGFTKEICDQIIACTRGRLRIPEGCRKSLTKQFISYYQDHIEEV